MLPAWPDDLGSPPGDRLRRDHRGGRDRRGAREFIRSSRARCLSIAANGPLSNADCFSGLVSNRLLRLLPVPVLVQTPATFAARAGRPNTSGPIVVPLDGSDLAELALPEAVDLAHALGVEINLVHGEISSRTGGIGPLALEATIAATLGESTTYLERVATRIRAEGVAVKMGTGLARPADFIRDYVHMQDASMVIMSTRGRSGLGGSPLGHVAEAVIREVSVPLLLIGPTALDARRDDRQVVRPLSHVQGITAQPIAALRDE